MLGRHFSFKKHYFLYKISESGGEASEMKHKKIRRRTLFLIVWISLIALLLLGIILLSKNHVGSTESIKEVMKDGVLHENDKINLFGTLVNPGLISAYIVTAILLVVAAIIRIFAIPKFKDIPGKFQSVIEKIVEFFTDMAKGNSPHKSGFVGAYIFSAGLYIFFGTLFELFGIQAVSATPMPAAPESTFSKWVIIMPVKVADTISSISQGMRCLYRSKGVLFR